MEYDLITKHELCKKKGIDYLCAGSGISLETQKENLENILKEIIDNAKLLEIFNKISDEFWDEVQKKGIIIYKELAQTPNGEEEYLIGKKQWCHEETFKTISGEEINIETPQAIPVLAYQKKKQIQNRIY